MKRLRRFSFLLLVWLVPAFVGVWTHYEAWIRVGPSPLPEGLAKVVSNLTSVAAAPGYAVALRLEGYGVRESVAWMAFVHLFSWLFWVGLVVSLLRVRAWLAQPRGDSDRPSRRRFLVDATLGTGALACAGGAAYATLGEPWRLVTRRYTVPIDGLPDSFDGLRVAIIADTHLGPRIPAAFVREAVERALALDADAYALLGDYIHDDAALIDEAAGLFRPIVETGSPVVGVLGNHDWYGSGVRMSGALSAIGVRMIDDDRVFLAPDRRTLLDNGVDGSVCLGGLADLNTRGVDPDRALRGVGPDVPRIVLSHNPDGAEEPSVGRHRIDLMLSGHTHGGQVRVPFLGTPIVPSGFGQKYAGGLCAGPACRVLVSRGVGMSILPVRAGVPPEIVELTLVAGRASGPPR